MAVWVKELFSTLWLSNQTPELLKTFPPDLIQENSKQRIWLFRGASGCHIPMWYLSDGLCVIVMAIWCIYSLPDSNVVFEWRYRSARNLWQECDFLEISKICPPDEAPYEGKEEMVNCKTDNDEGNLHWRSSIRFQFFWIRVWEICFSCHLRMKVWLKRFALLW